MDNQKLIKVLVTGAGSGVGQSIVKSLRFSRLQIQITSADINYLNSGLYRADKAVLVPKVESKNALSWYIDYLNKKKINILMIGSEYDVFFFSKNKNIIEKKTKCIVCVSNEETIKISEDKYLTQKFLKKHKLPYLKTFIPKNVENAIQIAKKLGFPLILKNRHGTSAKNVFLIEKNKEIYNYFSYMKKPIMQEYAGYQGSSLDHEYTCSFFTTKEKKIIGPFIARRKLLHGSSWIVEVNNFPKIKTLIKKISNYLPNVGSLNVQLRDGPNGPVPFEFNARFSGTTCIRANFGFNEPEMFIRNYFFKRKINIPKINKGCCFRYLEEIFIKNCNSKSLIKNFSKGTINKWF